MCKNIYFNILKLCKKNNISVTTLCEEITGSRGNLQTWKKNNIRADYLVKIAQKFNITTDQLLDHTLNNSVDIQTIQNNRGIIGHTHAPVTIINGTEKQLSEQALALLEIFDSLDIIQKSKLISYASELREKQ